MSCDESPGGVHVCHVMSGHVCHVVSRGVCHVMSGCVSCDEWMCVM